MRDDVKGLDESKAIIHKVLDDAVASGVKSTDIILGGFSQGGAMAVYAGYSYDKPLAGVACLSGWAAVKDSFNGRVTSGANSNTPAFVFHGSEDEVVLPECGAKVKELLQAAKVTVTFGEYAMGHSSCPMEMSMLREWAAQVLALEG